MKKIKQYITAIGKRNKDAKIALAGIVVACIISGCWYLATEVFFPYAIAGEGTAVNPELQGIKPKTKDAGTSAASEVQNQNNQAQPLAGANQTGIEKNQPK